MARREAIFVAFLEGVAVSCKPPAWFDRSFSRPRLAPYLDAAQLDGTHAVDHYQWNLQVSEAFYPALSVLEISIRNAIHAQLQIRYGRTNWWSTAPLQSHHLAKVREAEAKASSRKRASMSADDVVAELSFGFWVSLLSRAYDRDFWVPSLRKAFPYYRGNRRLLYDEFDAMRLFRNRIMHHEPIRHRHLEADHAKIYRLLGYIEPDAVTWLKAFDRVSTVLTGRPRP